MSKIIKIGTSGYSYSWNKGKPSPFQWYVNQGFNSVEINASYYRFPMESWIDTWLSISPDYFIFSIKVNRYITDYTRLKGERALQLWDKFSKTLYRIQDKIDFWLFKMPPSLLSFLALESLLIMLFTLEYMATRNGITISIPN